MYLVLEIEHRHADKILLHIWNPFKLDVLFWRQTLSGTSYVQSPPPPPPPPPPQKKGHYLLTSRPKSEWLWNFKEDLRNGSM